MMKINNAPKIVRDIKLYELCFEWASGKMSDAPMYNRNPAKKPRYKVKK